jgi:hypothetical protein
MQDTTFKKVHLQTLEYKENKRNNEDFKGQDMLNDWGRKTLLIYE